MGGNRTGSSCQRCDCQRRRCSVRVPDGQYGIFLRCLQDRQTDDLGGSSGSACHGVGKICTVERQNQLPRLIDTHLEQHLVHADVREIKGAGPRSGDPGAAVGSVLGEADICAGRDTCRIIRRYQCIEIPIAQYTARRTLRTHGAGLTGRSLGTNRTGSPGGTLRANRPGSSGQPLRTHGAGGAYRSLRTNRTGLTGGTLGAGRSGFTGGTLGANRPGFSNRSLRACRSCLTGRSLRTGGTRFSYRSLRSDGTGGTGRSLRTGRSGNPGRSSGTNGTALSHRSLGADGSRHSRRASGTNGANRTGRSLWSYRSGFPYRPLGTHRPGNPLRASRSNRTSDSRDPLRACRASWSDGPLRPCRSTGAGWTVYAACSGIAPAAARISLGIPVTILVIALRAIPAVAKILIVIHLDPSLHNVHSIICRRIRNATDPLHILRRTPVWGTP